MLKLNLQFFGGRGASSGGSGGGATGGLSGADILDTRSLVSEREGMQKEVDETLAVFSDFYDEYGTQVDDIQLATLAPGSNAMAYYDHANIAVNEAYFNSAKMDTAYANCVASGFHPSNGSKTALQAVVAHEIGHKLTTDVGAKMGVTDFDKAATRIVTEARATTKYKSNKGFAKKISGYATHNDAETIAEAVSDVYCNGSKARSESRAIVGVMNKYLKGGN